jgi:hypothetical protein
MIASLPACKLTFHRSGPIAMFTLIAHRLNRLTRLLPQVTVAAPEKTIDELESGWHESSWVMARGLQVIELPPAAADLLFPDTQPSFFHEVHEAKAKPLAA